MLILHPWACRDANLLPLAERNANLLPLSGRNANLSTLTGMISCFCLLAGVLFMLPDAFNLLAERCSILLYFDLLTGLRGCN